VPLSEREEDVIRLVAQAMSNRKIALALGLSRDTVKWHLKNIYTKLGAASRDEALARIRELRAPYD
jgi:LuxR family maltose regulon positive regulatory protein